MRSAMAARPVGWGALHRRVGWCGDRRAGGRHRQRHRAFLGSFIGAALFEYTYSRHVGVASRAGWEPSWAGPPQPQPRSRSAWSSPSSGCSPRCENLASVVLQRACCQHVPYPPETRRRWATRPLVGGRRRCRVIGVPAWPIAVSTMDQDQRSSRSDAIARAFATAGTEVGFGVPVSSS